MKAPYFHRISIPEELPPTLEFLKLLQRNHLLHIPFENLDIHIGNPIKLDIDLFFEKIVNQNRGGFCYELNGLFYELLISLGFKVKRISARVYSDEKKWGAEFDHLALIVKIEDVEYLVDVGFGEFTLNPLKLEFGKIQKDERGDFILEKVEDDNIQVSKMIEGKKNPQYIFKNIARALLDYKDMCLFHQTSPLSHFTKKRLISKATIEGRVTLTGNILKIKKENQVNEIRLESEEQFHEMLWKYFEVKI